jgi:cell division septal protein FtsQ
MRITRLLIILLFSFQFAFAKEITINNLRIIGSRYLEKESIKELFRDQPFESGKLSLLEIRNILLRSPWVKKIDLTSAFFSNEITANLVEYKPFLVAKIQGKSWLVSKGGTLIQPLKFITNKDLIVKVSELPRVSGLRKLKGTFGVLSLNQTYHKTLSQIKNLNEIGGIPFQVDEYRILSDGALEVLPLDFFKYPTAIIDASDLSRAKYSLNKLRLVLRDIKKRKERASNVDLRYGNKVVVKLDKNK